MSAPDTTFERELVAKTDRILAKFAEPLFQPRELAPDGRDQDAEEDFLSACLGWPEAVPKVGVKPSTLWVIRFGWLLAAMLEQPKPGGAFDVEQLARSMARHGMEPATAGALIAELWSRPAGDLEHLARQVKALEFRRRALAAASRLAKASTPTEALAAVQGVLR